MFNFFSDAVERPKRDVETTQGVVESKVSVFIGAQYHSAAELFIEVTGSDADVFAFVADEVVGNALASISPVKTQEWVMVSFETYACTEVTVGVENIGTCIHEQFFGHIASAYDRVGM